MPTGPSNRRSNCHSRPRRLSLSTFTVQTKRSGRRSRSTLARNDAIGNAGSGPRQSSVHSCCRQSPASRTCAANGASGDPQISDDGETVLFSTTADNLDGADGNGAAIDIILADLDAATLDRVDLLDAGATQSSGEAIATSPLEGDLIVFDSTATDLDPLDPDEGRDVFLHNRATGATTLISVNDAGDGPGDGDSSNAKLSADGNLVVFQSEARNLVDVDPTTGLLTPELLDAACRAHPGARACLPVHYAGQAAMMRDEDGREGLISVARRHGPLKTTPIRA